MVFRRELIRELKAPNRISEVWDNIHRKRLPSLGLGRSVKLGLRQNSKETVLLALLVHLSVHDGSVLGS